MKHADTRKGMLTLFGSLVMFSNFYRLGFHDEELVNSRINTLMIFLFFSYNYWKCMFVEFLDWRHGSFAFVFIVECGVHCSPA